MATEGKFWEIAYVLLAFYIHKSASVNDNKMKIRDDVCNFTTISVFIDFNIHRKNGKFFHYVDILL